MTDKKPEPTAVPRPPLVLPANRRDVSNERVGTLIGIVGVTAAGEAKKPG